MLGVETTVPIMSHSKSIVHDQNGHFITFTDEVDATQIVNYIEPKFIGKEFLPGTEFIIVAGSHHGLNKDGKVKLGSMDFKLLQGFYYKLFNTLQRHKNSNGVSMWEEQGYKRSLVPISAKEKMDLETFESKYELSEVSRWDVKQLAKKLRKSKRPSVLIFASCYSFQSEIRELLIANGILASLNISKDRGMVSEGKMFELDKQQQEIIDTIVKVNSKIINHLNA